MNVNDCPCKGCVPPKRNAECHSKCPEYIEWNTLHQQELEKIRAANDAENDWARTRLVNRIKRRNS